MGKIIDTLKGLIPSGGQLLNFGSSIASLIGRNKNIDKQLNAQKEENQKNRDFNLMLAQMQNEWNQNQWERENEYNTPLNQMKRFKEAGLNPDLIYGQGTSGNAMQLSGGLTAGAPSSPTDFTALGQKMSIGDALRQSLQTDLMRAQIDNIKADSESKRIGNETNKIDLETKQALQNLTGDSAESLINKYTNSNYFVRKALTEFANLEKDYAIKGNQAETTYHDSEIRRIDRMFHQEKVEKLMSKLQNELDLSKEQLDEFVKGTVYRIRGLKADTESKESLALWNDAEFLEDFPKGLPTFIKLVRMMFGK